MKVVKNWRAVLRWAWSVRLIAVAALLQGAEFVLPLFSEAIPRGRFALVSFVVTVAAFIARFVTQPKVSEK
jgi:hypothetical protein